MGRGAGPLVRFGRPTKDRRDDALLGGVSRAGQHQNEVMTIRPSSLPAFMSLNTWLMSSIFISW